MAKTCKAKEIEMKITITAAQLEKMGACSKGVKLFKETYGDKAVIKWTLDAQLELIKSPMGRYLGWAFWNKLLPLWSMYSVNLSSANLSSADLSYANLSYANLSYADNLHGVFIESDPIITGYKFDNGRLWKI
jgi:uncharacterized protein YjbI with pentapeptide repeats